MGAVNKAIIVGNLGRDAELRFTPGGQAVATVSIATTEKWTDSKTGAKKEDTQWHNVVIWGKTAESLQQYLLKGKQIYVEGKLKTKEWDDKKNGSKQRRTEIHADRVVLLSGGGGERRPVSETSGAVPSSGEVLDTTGEIVDDDIPF